ncbi:MAG: hypothetical protein VYE15_07575, partial [Myxococcota bacterium]|nr:hypothetical protein [Myxococcota bacterium]
EADAPVAAEGEPAAEPPEFPCADYNAQEAERRRLHKENPTGCPYCPCACTRTGGITCAPCVACEPKVEEPDLDPDPVQNNTVKASAEPAPNEPSTIRSRGDLHFRHGGLTDFPTDTDGVLHGQQTTGHLRAETGLEVSYGPKVKITMELQLVRGQVYGDESLLGQAAGVDDWQAQPVMDQVMVSQFNIVAPVGIGVMRVGRLRSQWGLGLLANSGKLDDEMFVDESHGDYVNRIQFITRPLEAFLSGPVAKELTVSVGVDYVEQDDLSSREEGDAVRQGIGAIIWRRGVLQLGTYMAYRHMIRANGDRTTALALDLYGRWSRGLGAMGELTLEGELAGITGSTEDVRFEGVDGSVGVRQLGFVGRAALTPEGDGLLGRLDFGWAPGDNAPQDDALRSIRFDPGYKVGMILFQDVLARTSARSVDHATDPGLVGKPSHGYERIPSGGSVHNAIFFNPQVGIRLLDTRLEARLGGLVALADGDVYDPYQTTLAGGFVTNAFGQSNAGGLLGTELNAGAVWRQDLFGWGEARVGARYGLFLPGAALADASGEAVLPTIHKWSAYTAVSW